jgi:hypothetical protein
VKLIAFSRRKPNEAAIPSEAKPALHQEEKEQVEERKMDRQKEKAIERASGGEEDRQKDRDQLRCMRSVEESRHEAAIPSEAKPPLHQEEREQAEEKEIDRKKRRGINEAESIQSESRSTQHQEEREQAQEGGEID